MAETLHHLGSVIRVVSQLDKWPAFKWFSRQISPNQLQKGDLPSLSLRVLASGESCSSTVSFWPFFSFLSFFDLKFAALKTWSTSNAEKPSEKKNMWWKWHLYLHPRQCLIWMEPHILAQYLYETMKRDTCKMVHLPFVPKQWTNKTSICECLLQYGLEVKTSSPPCRRCGWIEVTFVERTGTLHGSTSYWDLTIAATVSNYICHSFMGSGQILLVQLAKQT